MREAADREAIALHGVSRTFGGQVALADIDLSVPVGDAVLVVGPNGAGKSTLLRLVATLLTPTFGRGAVLGHDLVRDRRPIRAHVELLGHRTRLYEQLTPAEYLRFVDRLDARRSGDDTHAAALARAGLTDVRDERMASFSNGMRQRVALARARLRAADVMLLDEPYAGLDASAMNAVDELLVEARAEGRTVVVATHDVDRCLPLVTRLIEIESGRVVEDRRP